MPASWASSSTTQRAVRPRRRRKGQPVRACPPADVEKLRRTLLSSEPRTVAASRPGQRPRGAYVAAPLDAVTLARDAAIVSVLAYAGLRLAEALALRWSDVRDDHLMIARACDLAGAGMKGTKTETTRVVRLLAPLARDLREWLLRNGRPSDDAEVFPTLDGKAWRKADWDNWRARRFAPTLKRAELPPARPYDLRHSFASLLLAEGHTVHYVASQLGHGAEQTLRTYGHVIDGYAGRPNIDAEAEIRDAKTRESGPTVARSVEVADA